MFKEKSDLRRDIRNCPEELSNLKIFINFRKLIDNAKEIREKLTESNSSEDSIQKNKMIRASFLKISLLVTYMAYYNHQRHRGESDDAHKEAKNKTMDIIGDTIREIALNTEKVETLHKIYKEGSNKPKDNIFWSQGLPIKELNETIGKLKDNEITYDQKKWADYTRAIISQSLCISESNVRPFITANIISNLCFRRLIFGLILQAMFINVFKNDFMPMGINSEDSIIGSSGIRRYLDGFLRLTIPNQGEKVFLLKLVNLSIGDTGIICSTGISLKDIKKRVKDEVNSIVFIPGYPTSESLEREIYWRNESRINLNLLYLNDFFEMFKLWKKKDVRRFLIEKLK